MRDQLRALIFQEGICVLDSTAQAKQKILLNCNNFHLKMIEKNDMHVIIGSNGPCKISVNVGGKVFRTPSDEIQKGLVSGGASAEIKNLPKVPKLPKIPL